MRKLIFPGLVLALCWACNNKLEELSFFTVAIETPQVKEVGQISLVGRLSGLRQENVESCGFIWTMQEDSIWQHPESCRRILKTPPAGNDTFTAVFHLKQGETAYFRAFAEKGERKVYSENNTIFSLGNIVEMVGAAQVDNNRAAVFGMLSGLEDQQQTIEAYGHVYSAVNEMPTLDAPDCDTSRYINEYKDVPFTSYLKNLDFNTTYHVRAYAVDGDSVFYSSRIDTFRIRDGWIRVSDFPEPFSDGAATNTDAGDVFAGFGINNSDGPSTDILKEFWQFNPANANWTEVHPFDDDPENKRTNTSMFTIGDTIYVIFGHHNPPMSTTTMIRNFWKYTISTDSWYHVPDIELPFQNQMGNRSGAVGFVIGTRFYVGGGHRYSNGNLVYLTDFWEYNPETGRWKKMASIPMQTLNGVKNYGRYDAVGFASATRGYIGSGDFFGTPVTDFWRYTPIAQDTGKWEPVADPFPGPGRIEALSFTIGDKAYYGCGYNLDQRAMNDFYEFDMTTEKWRKRTSFQGGVRHRLIGFSQNGYGYGGTGLGQPGPNGQPSVFSDMWRYVPESQ